MLGDRYEIELSIGNIKRKLSFNYQLLKNLYRLVKNNPLEYLQEFILAENKDDYLATILYCMCNADIELNDIGCILQDKQVKGILLIKLIDILNIEFQSEYKEAEDEDDKNQQIREEEQESVDKNKQFEHYFNNSYYIATAQLHKTEEEFYKMTPRELKTLDKYNNNYYKNILLSAYIEVLKSRNTSNNEGSEKENIKTVARFKDIFR